MIVRSCRASGVSKKVNDRRFASPKTLLLIQRNSANPYHDMFRLFAGRYPERRIKETISTVNRRSILVIVMIMSLNLSRASNAAEKIAYSVSFRSFVIGSIARISPLSPSVRTADSRTSGSFASRRLRNNWSKGSGLATGRSQRGRAPCREEVQKPMMGLSDPCAPS